MTPGRCADRRAAQPSDPRVAADNPPVYPTRFAGRAHVGIIGLEPVGSYAVRITFDDLHEIYSWAYLYQLGFEHEKRWRAYLKDLVANRLSREPARQTRVSLVLLWCLPVSPPPKFPTRRI